MGTNVELMGTNVAFGHFASALAVFETAALENLASAMASSSSSSVAPPTAEVKQKDSM